jgi:transcriptional regulator with XRE-family HTH domain
MRETLDGWTDTNPLKVWRQSQGMSRLDVCPALDVTYNAIAKWENGATKPSDDHMVDIERITKGAVTASLWDAWREANPLKQ